MARVAGINIPDGKPILIALTSLFGIGRTSASKVLALAKIDPGVRTKTLTEVELNRIREIIDKNYEVEGDLRVEINQNIKRLKNAGSYRGVRHSKGLPVRGQRTKTNARTKRGKKVTVGSGRKKTAEKT